MLTGVTRHWFGKGVFMGQNNYVQCLLKFAIHTCTCTCVPPHWVFNSVAPTCIQQYAYMPICVFLNPNCLHVYADPNLKVN